MSWNKKGQSNCQEEGDAAVLQSLQEGAESVNMEGGRLSERMQGRQALERLQHVAGELA